MTTLENHESPGLSRREFGHRLGKKMCDAAVVALLCGVGVQIRNTMEGEARSTWEKIKRGELGMNDFRRELYLFREALRVEKLELEDVVSLEEFRAVLRSYLDLDKLQKLPRNSEEFTQLVREIDVVAFAADVPRSELVPDTELYSRSSDQTQE